MNVVAIRGHLSRPAEERTLPAGGARLIGLDLIVRRAGAERADSVPVAWYDPPAESITLDTGDEVVVVGHVARRFFRAGGSTQSRTEVVASKIILVRKAKKVAAALTEVISSIEAAMPVDQ